MADGRRVLPCQDRSSGNSSSAPVYGMEEELFQIQHCDKIRQAGLRSG